eukprot:7377695-Prymnesium_polylepis.1
MAALAHAEVKFYRVKDPWDEVPIENDIPQGNGRGAVRGVRAVLQVLSHRCFGKVSIYHTAWAKAALRRDQRKETN